ncbi:MAG: ATP-dependent DNA helicase RecG [Erysipelotrichaceae bacterium]|nr:ATP-dependent DNA helicase RecG [Erysipelotrichaceae bacterium]
MELSELKLTEKRKEICRKLDLKDSDDILRYYPFKYDKYEMVHYEDFVEGERVVFEGELLSYPSTFRFRKNLTKTSFRVLYEEEEIQVTIFNRPWIKGVSINSRIVVVGKYDGRNRVTATTYFTKDINDVLGISPVYSLKEGIRQNEIVKLIEYTFDKCDDDIKDEIPEDIVSSHGLVDLKTALHNIHKPQDEKSLKQALARLKYEEFLRFYLSLEALKGTGERELKKAKIFDQERVNAFIDSLPFELTKDQASTVEDIFRDMRSSNPMYRLIQGEVGSGKTAVAMIALYANMLAGYQGAIMAPTEILAKQHYESFRSAFGEDVRLGLLYSGAPDIKETKERLKKGMIDIVAGTHALFQEDVAFNDLGLVIADEQHRFGVKQRRALKDKGESVDFIIMSATPIPRTLASSIYGDMDISTIATLPSGRQGCDTYLINRNSIVEIIPKLKEKLEEGRQIYIIASAIEASYNYAGKDASSLYNSLIEVFAPYKLALMHGRLSTEEKDDIMDRFNRNEIQILVSTTVVEVGVNVKNATVMVIYDADRFGLSQLHQLRGRIQRGNHKGTCYLLTDNRDSDVLERLNVLCQTNDGFRISEADLRLRGPGDILGTRQSGLPAFILGNIFEDGRIIEAAKKDAKKVIAGLDREDYGRFYDSIAKLAQKRIVD